MPQLNKGGKFVFGLSVIQPVREDTVLLNFLLYYPKCKQEALIEVNHLQVTIMDNPDKETIA